jgi:hypothetical protein
MAETTEKTTHKRAKGRTIDGQPHRRRTGRAGAREKRPLGPQKAAQAEAQKRKKTTLPRKRPRAGATIQPPDAGGATDNSQAAQSAKDGIALLKQEAAKILQEDFHPLLHALKKKALKGYASSMNLIVEYAKPGPPAPGDKSVDKSEDGCFTNCVQDLAAQPEFIDPADDKDEDKKPEPVVIDTIHAVAED